jgi:hypothetical protein
VQEETRRDADFSGMIAALDGSRALCAPVMRMKAALIPSLFSMI